MAMTAPMISRYSNAPRSRESTASGEGAMRVEPLGLGGGTVGVVVGELAAA